MVKQRRSYEDLLCENHELRARLAALEQQRISAHGTVHHQQRWLERILASEQQFREILDKLVAGVTLLDSHGRYVFVNQPAAAFLGVTANEISGRSIHDFFTSEDVAFILAHSQELIASQSSAQYERSYNLPTGQYTFLVADQILSTPEGDLLLSSFVDITPRIEVEADLKVALTKYRTLFESFPLGITVSDLNGQIVESNPTANHLLGIGLEEHVQRQIDGAEWQIVRPDGSPMPAAEFASVRALNEHRVVENVEMGIVTPAGTITWINVTAAPLPLESYGVVITYSDITARKEAEAALHQALQELTRSNADLEEFAYVASHDLQEPLRGMVGMVQLLKQRYGGQIDDRADRYIELAVDAALRMQHLIDDLLLISRVERHGQPFAAVASEEALKLALMNLHIAIKESEAQITYDPLPTVYADLGQLSQVFQNLIGNAIKFCHEVPPIIHIRSEEREGACCFAVRDNGIGIAPDHFEQIFVIFQRLYPRQNYPGTGIGLALCKKIVERHGGQIWVVSRLGYGATFFFTIPDRH